MPNYDALVQNFDRGDVLFGLDPDLTLAQAALSTAYGDGATFWGAFSRAGRKRNKKAKDWGRTDVVVQASLTNAVAGPGELQHQIGQAIPEIKRARTSGQPLTAPPMSGDYLAPPDHIKSQGLPNEPNRGVEFASFLDQHPKFDPKLMGGRMNANGTFAPLGDRASDREWIAIKQAEDFKLYVTEELDSGQPLHLKGGKRIPHRPKGQNRPLVDHHWAEIDLGQYDMYEILAEAHLKSISNYKIWKRTSKAGLEFQTDVRDRAVHFLLDTFLKGDGMKSAIKKTGHHGKSITAGEIRWIYRNWANPKVQKNVHFWTIHGEVDPPWEMATYRDLWAEYQPESWKRDASMRLASALSVHE